MAGCKKDSLNIPMVLSVGDVVNYDNNANWETASTGDVLDRANIPYAIAVGNHDTRAVGLWSGAPRRAMLTPTLG
ncbi:hypothetical protein [Mucilaginibacter antarcticus]|uniref:hypothetical protein n=1 Tax=Mucilaginibacter antarcticus TaxID=1855725 RepID=UPI00363E63A6